MQLSSSFICHLPIPSHTTLLHGLLLYTPLPHLKVAQIMVKVLYNPSHRHSTIELVEDSEPEREESRKIEKEKKTAQRDLPSTSRLRNAEIEQIPSLARNRNVRRPSIIELIGQSNI